MFNTPENIPRRVFFSLVAASIAFGGTIFALIFWMTAEANRVARDGSIDLVAASVQAQVDQLATLTLDYAYWEDAYTWVMDADTAKVESNLGLTATEGQLFQHMWITKADGAPLYGYAMGTDGSDVGTVDDQTVATYLSALALKPLEPYETLSGLVMLNGGLAIVAAGRIQLYETDGNTAADFPVMLTVAYLSQADTDLITDLGNASVALRFTRDGFANGEGAALAAMDIDGSVLGHLVWTPPRPGDTLFAKALPVAMVLVLVMFVVSVIVGRTTAGQARALVQEHIRARTDELTGALNVTALEELLASTRFNAALTKGQVAVAYIDINRFKALNDTHGHAMGDVALCSVATRLKTAVRNADHVVRKGGDEFLCIIEDPKPQVAASRISKSIAGPSVLRHEAKDPVLMLTLSIGIAVADGSTTWDKLLRQADRAMYHAKKSDIHGAVFYDEISNRREKAA